jgi:PAS domain S-box-containing protein
MPSLKILHNTTAFRVKLLPGAMMSVFFFMALLVQSPALGQVSAGPASAIPTETASKLLMTPLTEEEQRWLREHPVIRVVQDPGWPPVEFVDDEGEPSGISNDYLNLIQERLGITFERVRHLSWQEAYSRLKRWDIDMTTSVAVTPARTEFWAFTKPYLEIPIVILTHADVTYVADLGQLGGKKVAVVDGYAVTDWIPRDFPEITLVKVRDVRAGLELLQRDEVFAFVDNMLVIGYYLSRLKIANLKIAGETPYQNAQAMAVRKDWAILAGILQKALDSITEEQRGAIYRKWVPIRYDHGFNYSLLWRILAVFALILGGLLLWNRKLAGEIRHRKNAEKALMKSEQRFRQLFNVAPVPLAYVRQDGLVADVNERFVQTFGFSLEEVPTIKNWSRLAYPDPAYRRWVNQAWEGILGRSPAAQAGLPAVEHLVTCKNGQVRSMVISAALLEEDVLAAFFDITEIKRAEKALRESEEKYRALVECAGVVVLTFDTQGLVTFVNDHGRALFGYTDGELIGRPLIGSIVPEKDAAGRDLAKMVEEICRNPEQFQDNENENITRSGQRIWIRWNNKAILDSAGSPTGILAIGTDISDRKQAEREKEKLQIQLAHAQKMEAVGTMAGGIAHDFNNLLQAVTGYTQLLLYDKTEHDAGYENLMAIEKAGSRAAELVRQLLLFSRKAETKRKPVELNRELEQVRQILERTIPKMVAMEIRPHQGLWTINADPIQIEQMLLNLGSNAADAMPDGGRLILETDNLTLDQGDGRDQLDLKPGRYVRLTVSDTGQGMDPETMEHIFDPFFTTKALGKGTGLGLASVYGIVKSHGGHINCYSEKGLGTTFKIYLPTADPTIAEPDDDLAAKPVRGGTETILLVDDEEMVRNFGRKLLERFGYTVLTAASGEEALEIYTVRPRDLGLVIMDIGMPGMGGYKCFHEIMRHDPTARVLIATGYAAGGQVEQALAAGAAGYVGKPYQVAELLGKVREILDNAK